jgi:hypothetical protein
MELQSNDMLVKPISIDFGQQDSFQLRFSLVGAASGSGTV